MDKKALEKKIVELMKHQSYKPLSEEDIIDKLAIKGIELNFFWDVLKEMEQEGIIVCTRFNTYGLPEKMNLVVGNLSLNNKGFGFLVPDNKEEPDIFIPPSLLSNAMNGDRVIGRINSRHKGRQPEGEIIRILKRAYNTIVGNFQQRKNFGFVLPDDKKVAHDLFISLKDFNGAQDGQKVVAEITVWPKKGRSAEGKIVEVLGNPGDVGLEILSIIKQYDFPTSFPEEIMEATKKVSTQVEKKEYDNRRDLRDRLIVTIDSDSAKDLDDAVYVEQLDNDLWMLGVYIADVSYYVKKDSIIDKEARARATSLYFVDRVIPMLPERLSNGICSLNAQEDRLVMSCEMKINSSGKVVSYDIFPAVIKVTKRLSYPVVKEVVEDNIVPADFSLELVDMLKKMVSLRNILRQKRLERGAIDFDFPEQKIILNPVGKPLEIKQIFRTVAESIIEEFMLAANETVAEHLSKLSVPSIYRIHEDPDEEKIESLSTLLDSFALKLTTDKKVKPLDLQNVLKKIQGKAEEKLIGKVILRSLKQAEYKSENLGHFGLAAKYYTHFTSPIRRYPDLVVHRLLKETSKGKLNEKQKEKLKVLLVDVAEHSSKRERMAEQAERDIQDLKKAEYMVDYVGQEFKGTISGVMAFGLFVELENGVEGLVHMSSLTDDYYIYVEEEYCLIGEQNKKIYRLGDPIAVEVLQVNILERTIDFILPGEQVIARENLLKKMQARKPVVKTLKNDKKAKPKQDKKKNKDKDKRSRRKKATSKKK